MASQPAVKQGDPNSDPTWFEIVRNFLAARGADLLPRDPMAPSRTQDAELQELTESPFVQDTLFQVTGTPKGGVVPIGGLSGDLRRIARGPHVGFYSPIADRIELNSDLSPKSAEHVLKHEAGHRLYYQYPKSQTLSADSMAAAYERLRDMTSATSGEEGALSGKLSWQRYAASDPREHWAETFASALGAMRLPSGAVRDSAIAARETDMPGTAHMARYLATQRPFGTVFTEALDTAPRAIARDATAIRPSGRLRGPVGR